VLGRNLRQLLFRNTRVATTFPSRAGETISLVTNPRRKDDVTASRKPGARNPKIFGRVPLPAPPPLRDHRTATPRSRKESKLTNGTSLRRFSFRVKIVVKKVRSALRRFRETASATNLQLSDLFPGNRMLAHVTAVPVTRSKHVQPLHLTMMPMQSSVETHHTC
jgi:hypothetical protein